MLLAPWIIKIYTFRLEGQERIQQEVVGGEALAGERLEHLGEARPHALEERVRAGRAVDQRGEARRHRQVAAVGGAVELPAA